MDGLWSFEPGMIVARYCGVTSPLLLRECGTHFPGWRVECLLSPPQSARAGPQLNIYSGRGTVTVTGKVCSDK